MVQAAPVRIVTEDRVFILPPPTGSDDTSMINTALTTYAGGLVRGACDENYQVSTLVGQSNTTLDMTGCVVTQIAATNADFFQCASQSGARTVMDGVTTASSTTFTSATAAFVAGDAGKTIWIYGAGTLGTLHKTTIASFTNSTTVVLTVAAALTTSGSPTSIGTRTTNVRVVGGIWDKVNNTGHSFRFRRSDSAYVGNLRLVSTLGAPNCKYGINFGDAIDFTVENITYNYNSDGVHLNGPVQAGVIKNLSGYTRDDMVSVTPNDWVGQNDVYGEVRDVKIDGVDLDYGANCAVKILGGSASPLTQVRGVRVRNVSGATSKTAQSFGGLVLVGDDTGSANTTGGFCDDITIENVSGSPGSVPDNSYLVLAQGSNLGEITIDGVGADSTTNTAGVVAVGGGTGTIKHAIVRNVRINRIKAGATAVIASANVTTERLTVENVTVEDWQSSTSSSILNVVGGTGRVKRAEFSNVRVHQSTGGILVAPSANVDSLLLDRMEINNSSNAAYIVNMNTASTTCTDCTISRVIGGAGWTSGYIAQVTGSTAGYTRLTIGDCHCTGVGGSPFVATTSGQILGTLTVHDSTFVGTSWGLGDYATNTDIHLTNVVTASSVNFLLNARASSSLRFRGAGNNLSSTLNVAAGATLASYCDDVPYSATAGAVPTVTAQTSAGTTATVSIVGNEVSGTVTVNCAGTGVTSGNQVQVTFIRTLPAAARVVICNGSNINGGGMRPYIASKATNGFMIGVPLTPSAGSAYTYDYMVVP